MDNLRRLRDLPRSWVRDSTRSSRTLRERRLEHGETLEWIAELECDDVVRQARLLNRLCIEDTEDPATPTTDLRISQTHPPGASTEYLRTGKPPSTESSILTEVGECAICLATLSNGTNCAYPCAHNFHRSCIAKWEQSPLNTEQLCPMCRTPRWERQSIGAVSIYAIGVNAHPPTTLTMAADALFIQ